MKPLKLVPNANEVLKEARLEKGMTQMALAAKMGLGTSQHVWNIENKKNRLTLELASKAAQALNIPFNDFLCEKVK